jgi:GrpB-like predicted nucleotidyltransferase (UPF0157 family)
MELGDARTKLRRKLVDAVLRARRPQRQGCTPMRSHCRAWAARASCSDDTLIVAERFRLVGRLTTEEQMRAVTIGELRPLGGPVVLVDYDADWPRLFEREAARIRAALGDVALEIEHVGSTAVPGLAAKPVIDVLLVIADSADEGAYVPALEPAGDVLRIREPDFDDHRLFKGPDMDVNLHVFSRGSVEIDRFLIFRDWLRSNAADRELYLRTKRELAEKEWTFTQHYADAKTETVEEILARAVRRRG